jgi:hypothetical protein
LFSFAYRKWQQKDSSKLEKTQYNEYN